MPNEKLNELNTNEIVTLYEKINEEVEKHIIENEMSINSDTGINKIFDKIARELIKNELSKINENFLEIVEAEQEKSIEKHLKRVEKVLLGKMKGTI